MRNLVTILVVCLGISAQAELWMPSLFSDNMMFQREKPVPVWGMETPGATVTVEFAGQKKTAVVGDSGEWQVVLDLMPASSKPRKITIHSSNSPTIHYSNLLVGEVWLISGQSNMQYTMANIGAQDDIASADNSLIRYFWQDQQITSEPAVEPKDGAWKVCFPETAGAFSAVGYYMARDLQKHLGVPVGLLYAARGGAPARCFISRDTLIKTPATNPYIEVYDEQVKTFPERKKAFDEKMADYKESVRTAKAAGKKPPQMPGGLQWGCMGPGHRFQPYGLYNGMIKPLEPFAIRGFAWYQGETDGNPRDSVIYRTMLPALIKNWRADWQDESLPFLIVQIASHRQSNPENETIGRPKVREAQLMTSQSVSNTALVVTIDVGERDNIHPKNKAPVGARLALAARKMAYGEDLVYSGPVFQTLEKSGRALLLSFTNIGKGLDLHSTVGGFEIAGADGKFVPAEAKVAGDRLKVWSSAVSDPQFVRYAWSGWPEVSLFNKEGLPASPFRSYTDNDKAGWK